MERVQFQQEQMLAELKDLVQKGIFTQPEIKQILKKRTAFETTLIRRIPKKVDFLRYAEYEMNLEALRRKRVERLNIPKGPPSVSDYALIRRQFQIFERALKKFKEDVNLWIQYIQVAQYTRSRALVSRICGRALQLHPTAPTLYIIAAAHELKHLSHASARVLLQRGLRINGESIDLWKEYVKMELGFVESLRRRWEVLGLEVDKGTQEKEADVDADVVMGSTNTDTQRDSEQEAEEEEIDDQARKEILRGALVKTVISSAAKAVPSIELFTSIHSVLSSYPCPLALRQSLLNHLYTTLNETLLSPTSLPYSTNLKTKHGQKSLALASQLYVTRLLPVNLEEEALVDALSQANEELSNAVRSQNTDDIASVYSQFVYEWYEKAVDENLNQYLLASLQSLCHSFNLALLFTMHIKLLRSPHNPTPTSPTKLLKLLKKYASKVPSDSATELDSLRQEIEAEAKKPSNAAEQ